jgi:peroxiredoxin
VELREAFAQTDDLRIVWVMSDAQINDRTRSLIGELGLADRILFLADPKSRLIRELGILKENPEAIEIGVPHPTTLVLDRSGTVQFVDVRENYHIWLDPKALTEVLSAVK